MFAGYPPTESIWTAAQLDGASSSSKKPSFSQLTKGILRSRVRNRSLILILFIISILVIMPQNVGLDETFCLARFVNRTRQNVSSNPTFVNRTRQNVSSNPTFVNRTRENISSNPTFVNRTRQNVSYNPTFVNRTRQNVSSNPTFVNRTRQNVSSNPTFVNRTRQNVSSNPTFVNRTRQNVSSNPTVRHKWIFANEDSNFRESLVLQKAARL